MDTTLLFKVNEWEIITKIDEILDRLGRHGEVRYEGKCEKEIFIRRTINKWFKNKSLVLYQHNERRNNAYKRYLTISNISYSLTLKANNIKITFLDYGRPDSTLDGLFFGETIHILDARWLEGNWVDNLDEHEKVFKMFSIEDIPNKKYVYKTFDWDKYPSDGVERAEEGMNALGYGEVEIEAKTLGEAKDKLKKLRKEYDSKGIAVFPDIIRSEIILNQ